MEERCKPQAFPGKAPQIYCALSATYGHVKTAWKLSDGAVLHRLWPTPAGFSEFTHFQPYGLQSALDVLDLQRLEDDLDISDILLFRYLADRGRNNSNVAGPESVSSLPKYAQLSGSGEMNMIHFQPFHVVSSCNAIPAC